ncbi:TlpA family protein disulfide reductase [Hugenholtzia roseola]|uniref:TlpA family protein disulfide reductase n=1 Tax=Hugenholtzia roseola TaxID=1002 RepID=UPI0004071245|nr:TlpA disulfide reductase family protein [Hugenholtzia roseola]
MRGFIVFFLIFASASLSFVSEPQSVQVWQKADLEKLLKQQDSLSEKEGKRLEIINFWATWCQPCVAELPHFEALQAAYRGQVRVRYLSLDFEKDLQTKLIPFAQKRLKEGQVILLNDTDYDNWMGLIDAQWSGAIPATLFLDARTQTYHFVPKALEKEELRHITDSLLQK